MTQEISERYKKYLKTILINNGYAIENISYDEMKKIYHDIKSEITKRAYDKWLQSCLKRNDSFSSRAKMSYTARAIKFLQINNMSYDHLSDIELTSLGWHLMNDKAEHGKKIKKGIHAKHADIEQEYRRRFYLCVAKHFNKQIDEITKSDISYYVKYIRKLYIKDTIEWKRKHVIKAFNVNPDSIEEIEKLYSLYLSQRFKRASLECKTNGWSRTQKDWYSFKNCKLNFFYRSSWEKVVCELLDDLLEHNLILDVFIPEYIEYYFDNKLRRYYPDIGVITNNDKKIIFEIKPKEHTLLALNQAKFMYAKQTYNDLFIILTEDEIFNADRLKEILI